MRGMTGPVSPAGSGVLPRAPAITCAAADSRRRPNVHSSARRPTRDGDPSGAGGRAVAGGLEGCSGERERPGVDPASGLPLTYLRPTTLISASRLNVDEFACSVVVSELPIGAKDAERWQRWHERWVMPAERVGRVLTPHYGAWLRASRIISRHAETGRIGGGGVKPSFYNDCLLAADSRDHGYGIVTHNREDYEVIALGEPSVRTSPPFPGREGERSGFSGVASQFECPPPPEDIPDLPARRASPAARAFRCFEEGEP
jgi:predicted nucleic acid-binding protein